MTTLLRSRSAAERERVRSLVDVALEPAQRAAVELPPGRALLVLGEAGHGKSTVLLHRVLRLAGTARRAAIVVPTAGLVRLFQRLLRRRGADVAVLTYDDLARRQARRSFRRLPPESELTPPAVARLKRSAALRSALVALAERAPGIIDEDRDAAPERARVSRGDLQHLFGDRVLMSAVAAEAGLAEHVVEAVLDRTRVQFSATTERAWAHVTDRERLIAVDGRRIDEGTATAHATTIDVEDYAVLFALERLRAERAGAAPCSLYGFDLLAIDEAQELAPLELELLGRSVAPGGTLIVAGDAEQHTDETSTFPGWDDALRALGALDHARVELPLGFRCPPDVVRAARAVRDGAGDPDLPVARFDDEAALVAALAPEIVAILERDRDASIGVVCRRPLTARRFAALFRQAGVPIRLVFDGRFLPRGPVQVTIVTDVKGLELDWIIVPDASKTEWPDDAPSRRALYVALTRARHQAFAACAGEPTPLLSTPRC